MCVKKLRVSASGRMDDNSTVRGIMKRSVITCADLPAGDLIEIATM